MPVIQIEGLTKTYKSGLQALKRVDLTIEKGEIFALLGPNGAGKTTLISIVCGIVTPTTGTVVADGHDIQSDFRAARTKIGLVPQELTTDAFETVLATVTFSRGLFGKAPNPAFIEGVLNLRGEVMPVIDLRTRFGLPPAERTSLTRIVITPIGGVFTGLVVDAVSEVKNVDQRKLEEPPKVTSAGANAYIQKVARTSDGVVFVLDLQHLLRDQESRQLETFQGGKRAE